MHAPRPARCVCLRGPACARLLLLCSARAPVAAHAGHGDSGGEPGRGRQKGVPPKQHPSST
eukprot:2937221-Lingulodinium_polyedra.AAC.1